MILIRSVGSSVIFAILPTILLGLYILRYALFNKYKLYIGSVKNINDFLIYILFIIILIISLFRTNSPNYTFLGITNDIILVLLVNLAIYFLIKALFRNRFFNNAGYASVLIVILGPSFFICSLAVYYLLNYNSIPNSEGVFASKPFILGLMDVEVKNMIFKLGENVIIHPNFFGIYSGALFVTLVLTYFYMDNSKVQKLTIGLTILFLAFVIVITDSRITVLNSFITPFFVISMTKFKKFRFLPYFAFLIPLFPIISLFILNSIAEFSFVSTLSKYTNDIATGSQRATIWEYCFEELSNFKIIHLVGYGEYGHYKSGVSLLYAVIFNSREDMSFIVTHNDFFQIFFDSGYIGVVVYIALLYSLIKSAIYLYLKEKSYGIVFLGFIFYYIFSGVFESTYGSYNQAYTIIFFNISILIFLIKSEFLSDNILYYNKRLRIIDK